MPRRTSALTSSFTQLGSAAFLRLDIFRQIFPNAFGFAEVIEEQYIDRSPDREANIVTKHTGDGVLRLEDVAGSLDKYEAIEIFFLGEI